MSSPFTCVCPDGLPQARHSKQWLMVDQNSGVYLRASKIQAFALPYCLTLIISPQCYAHLVSNSPSCRVIAGPGRLNRKSGVTAHGCQPRALPTKVSGCLWHSSPSISLISRIFTHSQHLSSSQFLHLPF